MRIHRTVLAIVFVFGSQACDQINRTGDQASNDPNADRIAALQTVIKGVDANEGVIRSDSVNLSFSLNGIDSIKDQVESVQYQCRMLKEQNWKSCSSENYTISGLSQGDRLSLSARGLVKLRDVEAQFPTSESSVEFLVELSTSGNNPNFALTRLGSVLQVGTDYQVSIPDGMHLTEYSTSKTPGALSIYRILNESDPMYLGNHRCENSWERMVAGQTPAGDTMLYCHGTPTRAEYKAANEFRLANNHVEFATDIEKSGPNDYERLTVSIFDTDFELMNSRSRFGNVCQNSEIRFNSVPMIPNFFHGVTPERVMFFMCDVYLPNGDGSPSEWRIGAFYDTDKIDWKCPECKYGRAMEFTFMSRVNVSNHSDSSFARIAQERILAAVQKLRP